MYVIRCQFAHLQTRAEGEGGVLGLCNVYFGRRWWCVKVTLSSFKPGDICLKMRYNVVTVTLNRLQTRSFQSVLLSYFYHFNPPPILQYNRQYLIETSSLHEQLSQLKSVHSG